MMNFRCALIVTRISTHRIIIFRVSVAQQRSDNISIFFAIENLPIGADLWYTTDGTGAGAKTCLWTIGAAACTIGAAWTVGPSLRTTALNLLKYFKKLNLIN